MQYSRRVLLVCRRCERVKSFEESHNAAGPKERANWRCPDCGGPCDLFELKNWQKHLADARKRNGTGGSNKGNRRKAAHSLAVR